VRGLQTGGGEAGTERSKSPCRAQPRRAQPEPNGAEPKRASPAAAPRPWRPPASPRQPPAPELCCRPNLPTMPRAPPASATPQPRAAPTARSPRAAAPGMQVSKGDPQRPHPEGARPCSSPLRAYSLLSLPARSLPRLQLQHPQSSLPPCPPSLRRPDSILPSWCGSQRPRSCLLLPSAQPAAWSILLLGVLFPLSALPPSKTHCRPPFPWFLPARAAF
jgi:hypothetical protein